MGVMNTLSPILSDAGGPEFESRGCSPISFPSLGTDTYTSASPVSKDGGGGVFGSPPSRGDRLGGGGIWRLPALRNGNGALRRKRKEKPFDKRTIYDNSERVVDNLEMGKKDLGLVPASQIANSQQYNERRLIEKWRKTLRSPTRIGFAAQVMKDYKDPVSSKEPSYRLPSESPRYHFGRRAKSMDEVVESIARYRRGIARPVPKHYHQRTTCVDQNSNKDNAHFCDVLGPGTCSFCIEKTNRKFANDVERTLPVINVDSVGMVAPRLSKLLCSSSRDSSFEKTFNRMRTLAEKGDKRKRKLHIYLNVNGSCGMIEE